MIPRLLLLCVFIISFVIIIDFIKTDCLVPPPHRQLCWGELTTSHALRSRRLRFNFIYYCNLSDGTMSVCVCVFETPDNHSTVLWREGCIERIVLNVFHTFYLQFIRSSKSSAWNQFCRHRRVPWLPLPRLFFAIRYERGKRDGPMDWGVGNWTTRNTYEMNGIPIRIGWMLNTYCPSPSQSHHTFDSWIDGEQSKGNSIEIYSYFLVNSFASHFLHEIISVLLILSRLSKLLPVSAE